MLFTNFSTILLHRRSFQSSATICRLLSAVEKQKRETRPHHRASSSFISFWGGSGFLISTFHMNGVIPYWACMSLSCVLLRTCLLPFVVQGAHTQVQFARVAPDVQFVLTLFQQDRQMMQMDQRTLSNRSEMAVLKKQHFQATWRNLKYIYKKNNVHPLDIFKVKISIIFCFGAISADMKMHQ